MKLLIAVVMLASGCQVTKSQGCSTDLECGTVWTTGEME
jgi:hypothetical protein